MNHWLSPHYLQQAEWAAVRRGYDWDSVLVTVSDKEIPVRIYFRNVPLLGAFAYSPLCPPILVRDYLTELTNKAKKALPDDTFCIKLEPEQTSFDIDNENIIQLQKAEKSIQYEATVRIDLDRAEDEILASFDKGTRYNVRKAKRRGVKVGEVEITEKNLKKLFAFKELTSKRGGHYLRPKSFLMKFWADTAEEGKGRLFFAEHEEDLLAAIFVVTDGKRAWNKDSGSSRKKRSLAAPSLMHWEAMKNLKKNGVKDYDFSGVSPKEQRERDDNPMRGVDKFKTGFGEAIDYIGAYDYVFNSVKYRLWRAGEWLFIRLYHKITGLYWY